tara:strand:- start:296 stop:412 length:117 start_codon:yes stop_codon:yes gene_type:complete
MNRGFLAENAKNGLILAKFVFFFTVCGIFATILTPYFK